MIFYSHCERPTPIGLGSEEAIASIPPFGPASCQALYPVWCPVPIGHPLFSRGIAAPSFVAFPK